ncbi:MAG: hypothetical protein WCO71_05280 [Pseudomonadota bacterium]
MLFRISIVMVVAMNLFLSGCRSTGGSSDDRSIDNSRSVVHRADGNFDVTCSDGSKEIATKSDVTNDQVCIGNRLTSCWSSCGRAGVGFNDCVERCDVNSEPAVDLCWDGCKSAGFDFNVCQGKCGKTSVARGTSSCWTNCSTAGFDFNSCAGKCGGGSDSGAKICWKRCEAAGFTFKACDEKCGIEASAGATACWAWCQRTGLNFESCRSDCETSSP